MLTVVQAAQALPKIQRRIDDLLALDVNSLNEQTGDAVLYALENKVNATLRDVFGEGSIDYKENKISHLNYKNS